MTSSSSLVTYAILVGVDIAPLTHHLCFNDCDSLEYYDLTVKNLATLTLVDPNIADKNYYNIELFFKGEKALLNNAYRCFLGMTIL